MAYKNYFGQTTKERNTIKFKDHQTGLGDIAANRFIWKRCEDLLPPVASSTWWEYRLLKYGAGCIVDIDGKWTLAPCSMGGGLDKRFGTPERVVYYTNGGKAGDISINDTVVCLNNSKFYPTYTTINRYASMLAETDTSIEILTAFSRLIPIPIAETDKQYNELEKAISGILEGKPGIIKSSQLKGVEQVPLLDPDQIKNMECLSRLHDELIKRACSELGISITAKDKGAQLSIEELDSYGQYDAMKLYIPYQLRKDFCKKVNEKYGLDIDVELNPVFDNLNNGVNKSKEEMLNDETPEQEQTTPEPETPDEPQEVTEDET